MAKSLAVIKSKAAPVKTAATLEELARLPQRRHYPLMGEYS